MNPEERESLLQELLELHFDCHPDPAGMRARLDESAELRALCEEVKAMAGLLDEAAHAEAPPLDLEAPGHASPRQGILSFRRIWYAACAVALALVLPVGGWYLYQAWQVRELEASKVRLLVSAPPAVPDGSPYSFHVETYDLAQRKLRARVDWKLLDAEGQTLSSATTLCDGATDIALAGKLNKPRKLIVTATVPATSSRNGFSRTIERDIQPSRAAPLVHLTSDKPAYRPGEPVMLRIACLDRLTLHGVERGGLRTRILDPRGAIVRHMTLGVGRGVAATTWQLPPNAPGGKYRFEVRDPKNEITLEHLEFLVRSFQAPRLRKKITLDRETYAAGEIGNADLEVERVSGGPAAGAKVHATLIVDGAKTWKKEALLDAAGRAAFRFHVPADVLHGAARFVARVSDGSVVETELEPFLIPNDKIGVAFYPESGTLVAGTENRVYAQVRDSLGRPVSGEGRIVDDRGRAIAEFRTEHMGRARFAFTPERGRSYRLELELPRSRSIALPEVAGTGVVLRSEGDGVPAGKPAKLSVFTSGQGPWIAAAFCRGVLVGQHGILKGGRKELELDLVDEASGVLRITVFDHGLRPVAERLVQREASRKLDVSLNPEHERVSPGQKQKLTVRTRDEGGKPVSAIVGLSVSDQAVADMLGLVRVGLADQQQLWTDVERPDDKSEEFLEAKAEHRRNVDLLLGCQGWRRYVWKGESDVKALVARGGEWARALPLREGRSFAPLVTDTLAQHGEELGLARGERRHALGILRVVLLSALLGLSLLALLQGLFLLARRMQWRPEIVVPGGICATGLLVFLGLGSLAATMVEGRDDVMSRPAPESEAPRGFFYDDGLESDFRARTESFFATPGTGGGGVGLDLYGFGQTAGADDFLMGRGFRSGIQVVDADTGWNARLSAGALPRNVPFELGRSGLVVLNEAAGQASEAGLSGARFAIPDETAPQLQMRIHPNDFGLFYGSTSLVAPGGPTTVSPGVPFVRYLEGASYAYRHAAANARQSFVETLYWKPFLLTDAKGEATVEFEVSDRITTWSVHADAHGSGRVGQAEASFESFLPFHLEAKLPAQITAGDVVQAPIAVLADDPHQKEARVRLQVRGPLSLVSSGEQQVALVEGRGRILARLEVKEGHGKARLAAITITGHLGKARDEVTQTLLVLPRGFPRHESRAGTVRGKTELALVLPDEPARQSAKLTLRFYPSPLATIEQGLEGMLQEPHGCFEQASSSNYPNVMVLSLLEATGDNVPAASARARALLPAGYRKITGYECTERGYEWWGKNPGHAALTAYGLMQFQDMSRFHEVDQAMLARTRQWLLDKRDGKGGFGTAKGRYCHYWGGSEALRNAYITLALLHAGEAAGELETEILQLERRAETSDDAYELGVLACALAEAGRDSATKAGIRLLAMQSKDGSLLGKGSITGSGPRDLRVETTAFAVLAWLSTEKQGPAIDGAVQRAVRFLGGQRRNGRFGATQATILALKALTAYAGAHGRSLQPGTLQLFVNDKPVATRKLLASERRTISFDGLAGHLKLGENRVRIELSGGSELPWSLDLSYRADRPASSPDCAVALATRLDKPILNEGETVALHAVVHNRTDKPVPNPMVLLGLPAGLHVSEKILDDLEKAERIAFWELTERELVLYLRGLEAGEERDLVLDLSARIPGQFTSQASRSYLYYSADQRTWTQPLEVTVRAAR